MGSSMSFQLTGLFQFRARESIYYYNNSRLTCKLEGLKELEVLPVIEFDFKEKIMRWIAKTLRSKLKCFNVYV